MQEIRPEEMIHESSRASARNRHGVCRHCRKGLGGSPSDEFCCRGCKCIYESIHSLGFEEFYRYQDLGEVPEAIVAPSGDDFSYLDLLETDKILDHEESSEVRTSSLLIDGVHCAGCVWLLEKLPQRVAGLVSVRIDLARGAIRVAYQPKQLKLSRVAQILDSLGYPTKPLMLTAGEEREDSEDRILLLRTGVAGFCAANTMMVAVSLFEGIYTGIESQYASYFRWVSLILSLPAVGFSAIPFYRTAFSALRLGAMHIDVPLSLAILVSFFYSAWNTVIGAEYVYFDSATALIFLLLVGRVVLRRSVRSARRKLSAVPSLLPGKVRVRSEVESVFYECPTEMLRVGQVIEVRPGERFAADGLVLSGQSVVDMSVLTGESRPIDIAPGDTVQAGALNLLAPIALRTAAVSDNTRLGQILRAMREGSKRSRMMTFVDRASGYFVTVVLLLATATFFVQLSGGFAEALERTMALLIVTCPCALGIGVPLAMSLAISKAARFGILIRDEETLERLASVEHVFLDKTGTVSDGMLSVDNSVRASGVSVGDEAEVAITALARLGMRHPVCRALVDLLADYRNETKQFKTLRNVPGRGVLGTDEKGETYRLGSLQWLMAEGLEVYPELTSAAEEASRCGKSVACFGVGSRVVQLWSFSDRPRVEARAAVAQLRAIGKKVFLLSGDHPRVVAKVGNEVGIEPEHLFGGKYPEEKAEVIRASSRPAAMVGDGANDSLAIKAAAVGIAIRGGIDNTGVLADVVVVPNSQMSELDSVVLAFVGARRMRSLIKRNLCLSVVYNLLGAAGAISGAINPLVAAILMPLSSLTVILSSSLSQPFRSTMTENKIWE